MAQRSPIEDAEVCALDFAFHWGRLGTGVGSRRSLRERNRLATPFLDLRVEPALIVADATYVVNRSIVEHVRNVARCASDSCEGGMDGSGDL